MYTGELTYTTLEKGRSSSKLTLEGGMLVPTKGDSWCFRKYLARLGGFSTSLFEQNAKEMNTGELRETKKLSCTKPTLK